MLSLARKPVVNSPRALRDFNEKLAILRFPGLIPETGVFSSKGAIRAFLDAHRAGIVVKSLDSYQGRSVTLVKRDEPDFEGKIAGITKNFSTPVMIQEFLPSVYDGDKRILVLGGEAIGAVDRIPKKGSFLANFGQGGTGRKTRITERERDIVDAISGFLVENGLHFVGIDVIGGFLTEINITCPTGIVQIDQLDGVTLETDIVSYFVDLATSKGTK
jgi:glutathione synthase